MLAKAGQPAAPGACAQRHFYKLRSVQPLSDRGQRAMGTAGNRAVTALIYLNDLADGDPAAGGGNSIA